MKEKPITGPGKERYIAINTVVYVSTVINSHYQCSYLHTSMNDLLLSPHYSMARKNMRALTFADDLLGEPAEGSET